MSKRPYLLIFAVSAAFFAWVNASTAFGDPDAFYHLRLTRLTMADGPVAAFPWLPLTTLAGHFADHHFLYHLALAPFLAAFGDFLGLKIATVAFAAAAMAAFGLFLRDCGVRRPELWAPLLLLATGFAFRASLAKATGLALAAFFLFLVALRRRHRASAFAIAFAYVWLHGGWPLLLVAAVVDALVRRSARLVTPAASGLAAGLVLNPFFPANVRFYWEQIVQVAVLGRPDATVAVGAEWYPIEIGRLALENAAAFLPLALAAGIFAVAAFSGRPPRAGASMGEGRLRDAGVVAALAALTLLMTLRQARHMEYFLPLMLALGALAAEAARAAADVRALATSARRRLGVLGVPLAAALAASGLALAGLAAWLPHAAIARARAWDGFAGAGAYLAAQAPAGETVFHARWDDFPQLWYRAPEHRYVAGLDALFFYRADPERYWLWRDIGEGRRREGLADLIEGEFGARHVFLRTEPHALRTLIGKDPSFERVYGDAEAEIWRIRP
jgi:hypothetical protein